MTQPSDPHDLAARTPANPHWIHGLTGLLEILLLIGTSLAVAMLVQQNLSPGLMEALGVGTEAEPDFLAASLAMGTQLAAQYGTLLLLVVIVGYARRRRRLSAYAIARPKNHKHPLVYGLVAGLIAGIIPGIVFILQDISPIGSNTPFWEVQAQAEWDWRFWLFMAIGSFAIIPIVEEAAWRGYVQGRLMEGFAPGAAVLITTLIFALLHIQYLQADAALQLTFVGLVLASLIFGMITYRTGSLLPAIIAHALVNTPMSTPIQILFTGLGILALLAFHRQIARELGFWRDSLLRWSSLWVIPALALVAGIAITALSLPNGTLYAGGGLVLLVFGTGLWKRSAWSIPEQ